MSYGPWPDAARFRPASTSSADGPRPGRSGDPVGGSVVHGVAFGVDVAVGTHKPVAVSVRCGRESGDVVGDIGGRAVVGGVAERLDVSLDIDEPVPTAAGSGGHGSDVV